MSFLLLLLAAYLASGVWAVVASLKTAFTKDSTGSLPFFAALGYLLFMHKYFLHRAGMALVTAALVDFTQDPGPGFVTAAFLLVANLLWGVILWRQVTGRP